MRQKTDGLIYVAMIIMILMGGVVVTQHDHITALEQAADTADIRVMAYSGDRIVDDYTITFDTHGTMSFPTNGHYVEHQGVSSYSLLLQKK